MSHSHHGDRAGVRYRGRLRVALGLTVAVLAVEVLVALATGSLVVISDAGHVATDALGLAMALAAISLASGSGPTGHRTFGLYRLEILAALANAVLLLGVAAFVLVEAVGRLADPPTVAGGPVLIVGFVGVAANVVAFVALRSGATESMNVRGAYLEVLADTAGSVGVIVGAGILWITGWGWVDPILGAAIGLFIVPRAYHLGRDAVRVLTEAAPAGLDVAAVQADLAALPGVLDVHDLHVWTLTNDMDVLSAHLMVGVGVDMHPVLDAAREVLHERHQLDHVTLQIEPENHAGCTEVDW